MLQNVGDGVFFDSFLSPVCVITDRRRRLALPAQADNETGRY